MIDSRSKWIEAIPMHSTTTSTTVNALRVFFASFGLPEQTVIDNGPQFASKEFELFCVNNGIKHMYTPLYHPASNGVAERAVQVVKMGLAKMGKGLPQSSCCHIEQPHTQRQR